MKYVCREERIFRRESNASDSSLQRLTTYYMTCKVLESSKEVSGFVLGGLLVQTS